MKKKGNTLIEHRFVSRQRFQRVFMFLGARHSAWPPALVLAPGPSPQFVFTGSCPQFVFNGQSTRFGAILILELCCFLLLLWLLLLELRLSSL